MSEPVVKPSRRRRYGYLLRPIGAFLDTLDPRYVTIAEITDGFVWHCFKNGDPASVMSGSIASQDIRDLVEMVKHDKVARERAEALQRARRSSRGIFRARRGEPIEPQQTLHPVCPDGYEEMLRSLGAKLDDQQAHMILMVEREASIQVRFSLPLPNYIHVDLSRPETFTGFHEVEYSTEQIAEIIDVIYERRGIAYYQNPGNLAAENADEVGEVQGQSPKNL